MSHRIAAAALFAAAGLFATGAYAGSPFEDGGAAAQPTVQSHALKAAKHRKTAAAQPAPTASGVPMPKMDADGFEARDPDSGFYEHAVGSDGTTVASQPAGEAAPAAEPVYTGVMPSMAADGRLPREKANGLFDHAMGTMGAP